MSRNLGVLALWNDCEEMGEKDYERWYMAQHLPERIGVPGFRFGRRYVRLAADRKYFTFYETDSPDILWSSEYMRRLGNPTDWTQRVMQGFRNTIRTVCLKRASVGTTMGGHAVTFRALGDSRLDGASIKTLAEEVIPELAERDGVCHAHLWVAAEKQTPSKTGETDIRGADEMLSYAVVVETTFEEDARRLSADCEIVEGMQKFAKDLKYDVGIYRFACMMIA